MVAVAMLLVRVVMVAVVAVVAGTPTEELPRVLLVREASVDVVVLAPASVVVAPPGNKISK